MILRVLFASLALIQALPGRAQVFPYETITNNGSSSSFIDLVFLSDGYQASEMNQYILDVQKISNSIFSQQPFSQYKNYFNIIAIKVPSNQSGATHPKTAPDCGSVPVSQVDNYFGSSFDSNNIHRLLVPTKTANIVSVLAATYPLYDQVFVLVNSPVYGGSGGAYATSSTEASASEVSIHEIGHSFAGLADEYWAGDSYASEKPNMSKQSDIQLVRWKSWVGTGSVGVYPHSESPSWYRPHQNCKMRFLNVPFCNVCVENFVHRIQTITNPIKSFSPSQSLVDAQSQTTLPFAVTLIKPEPNSLKITWRLNASTIIAKNKESIELPRGLLLKGDNLVRAEVVDTSSLSRRDNQLTEHLHTVTWTVTQTLPSQTITFASLTSKTMGDPPFNLSATSTSGLPVQFTSASDKITLSGSMVTLLKAGTVAITANQAGSSGFNAAPPITQTFCINPSKPIIAVSGSAFAPALTSSSQSGNQWYKNGTAIIGATSQGFTPTESGIYSVKVTADNCNSESSSETPLVVTGDIKETSDPGVALYPNPAKNVLIIKSGGWEPTERIDVAIFDSSGKLIQRMSMMGQLTLDVNSYLPGGYILMASRLDDVCFRRFVKE